ncbi:ead/Ea22-like family protein [Escherichia coli]|nr:ead/Ea22-like family protein [Escherichia coli]HCU5287366.1 ead/Ea22-like family protein [Escherichia coli]
MSKINYQALREAAEKAGEDKWQAKKINGDFFVIRHGSYTRQHGYTSYQPIAEIDCKPVRDFVAKANPATVLALLDERERNQQYIKRRDQENEDIALTVGKLRVELEGKDKLIAELGKQCAEWERKALSNFEECAAMAERIEEMSKQSCEARERDLFESWVMHSICISKSTLEGLRTETGYRNATLSGTDFNRMWKQWKSIRAAGIRIKGE